MFVYHIVHITIVSLLFTGLSVTIFTTAMFVVKLSTSERH